MYRRVTGFRLRRRTALTLIALLLSGCLPPSTESDRSLLRKFEAQKPLFEQFAALASEKGAFGISFSRRSEDCELRRGLTELGAAELADYCEKMRRMDVERISGSATEPDFIAAFGMFATKGYVFRTRAPAPEIMTENLDKFDDLGQRYRHVEGDWYLYLRRDD